MNWLIWYAAIGMSLAIVYAIGKMNRDEEPEDQIVVGIMALWPYAVIVLIPKYLGALILFIARKLKREATND